MQPQDYAARTTYRPPARWYRRLNRIGVPLTSLGIGPKDAVTLEVERRSSGGRQRIPILRTPWRGDDYLVALGGESQWVRNVRAAGGRAVIRRGRARRVRLEELLASQRTQVIVAYLARATERSGEESAAEQSRRYFGLGPNPSLEEVAEIADYYPVFRIAYE